MANHSHPPRPTSGRLDELWDKPVRDLVLLPDLQLEDGAIERHRMYSLLLASLVADYWNGNKHGRTGQYPWRADQRATDGNYLGGDYLGHNIACLPVDGRGEVIDFDFNHNEIWRSSVEHAESRLIRRVFGLTQIYDTWATRGNLTTTPYANLLSDVTVYTSLESCSQCSGIMALGLVKAVVFLQRDPGQFSIGNILRNLNPVGPAVPPLPIPADTFGFAFFDRLNAAYDAFARGVGEQRPFYNPLDGAPDIAPSITSFLCTDDARAVFRDACTEFEGYKPCAPTYRPPAEAGRSPPLTNAQVLEHVTRFRIYATRQGCRGTPHKL